MSEVQAKRVIDWEAVEHQYRAGIRSLVSIGQEYGVSDAGIIKRAKRDGWTKDLKARIKAKAEAKVSAAAVSAEVSIAKAANEIQVVEANAELQYKVQMGHRSGLGKLRVIKDKLIDHIESVIDNFQALAAVVELVRNPDEGGQDRANDRLKKMMERSAVIDDLKKLAEIDEKVRKGEREAFGIDDGRVVSPVDQLLLKIANER